jgi:hypothetical protein
MTTDMQHIAPTALRPPSTRRRASESAQIVLFGTLAWIGYVWLAATVIYGIVIACVVRWGSLDTSLWRSLAAGWQQWVVFAAGITVSTTFLRMLLRNGATRRLVSVGAVATMSVIAGILAAWTTAGFSVEKLVYDANGWPQTLPTDVVFAWGDLPRLALDNVLVVAVYYATGWIIGCCYTRWGAFRGTALLLPAAVPVAAIEFLVTPGLAGLNVDVIAAWRGEPHIAVTILAGGALLAATVAVAARLTREATLR